MCGIRTQLNKELVLAIEMRWTAGILSANGFIEIYQWRDPKYRRNSKKKKKLFSIHNLYLLEWNNRNFDLDLWCCSLLPYNSNTYNRACLVRKTKWKNWQWDPLDQFFQRKLVGGPNTISFPPIFQHFFSEKEKWRFRWHFAVFRVTFLIF